MTKTGWHKTALIIVSLLIANATVQAQDQTRRMNQIIDNLIESYNSVDSVNYRRHFSPALLVNSSLTEIGSSLRYGASVDGLGKIMGDSREISAEGSRAIVVLAFTKNVFDMHLRLNTQGKLTRDNWLPHKGSWDGATTMTSAEIAQEKELYHEQVKQFAEAFLKRDPKKLVSLFPADEENARTLADHQRMVNRFEGKGEFTKIGKINYLGGGDVSVPLMITEVEGYEFILTFGATGKIVGMRLTNWAQQESEGKSLADLGADSLKTVDLHDITTLGDAFRAASGKVRFVTLLSPT